MKALQIHSEESLKRSKEMNAEEILRFLEDFRLLHGANVAAGKDNDVAASGVQIEKKKQA